MTHGKASGMIAQGRGISPPMLGDMLRRAEPAKTASSVAARIGAPVRTVEKWIEGACEPSAPWLARLVVAYGPGLIEVYLAGERPGWLARAALDHSHEVYLARRAALDAEFGVSS